MSEQKYGFLNGVPIDPGEGWEIVTEKEARFFYGADMRASFCYTVDGDIWILTNAPNWSSNILAFRRPITPIPRGGSWSPEWCKCVIAKQAVQAGQGESEAVSFRQIVNERTIDELMAGIEKLRTLTAAQSKALEKVEATIQSRDTEWVRVVATLETALDAAEAALNKSGQIEFQYLKEKALTLITAVKDSQ